MNMDKSDLWDILKETIQSDLNALADPNMELASAVAFRIAGEKIILNTMLKMEEKAGRGI